MKTTVPAHNLPSEIDLLQINSLLYDYAAKVIALEDMLEYFRTRIALAEKDNELLKDENARLRRLNS